MHVIIRADGNQEIAMGHIMRCLSIADALRERGAETAFVTAGDESRALLTARGYENVVLGTSYRDMEGELEMFGAYFRAHPAQLLLVDSYFITTDYMKTLGAWARTVWIDDLGEAAFPADILIDYNIYGPSVPYGRIYEKAGIPLPSRLLLGCGYAPLRAQFGEGRRGKTRERVEDVLITTGGGDMADAAGGLCRKIVAQTGRGLHKGIRYHVVCGPFSRHKESLRTFAEKNPAFQIHENVTRMWELMQKCDIAVSASGSTMYELCSMRLPAVCFYFAENQRKMAEYFDRTTDVRNAGDITRDREAVLERIASRLSELETDAGLRERIRTQMAELTDGRGAARIAEALEETI